MPIPDFQTLMLPLLELANDPGNHDIYEARSRLADKYSLSQEERVEMLPSGNQRRFDNRVAWAKSYLTHAGLLDAPKRGAFAITGRGKEVLKQRPAGIDIAFLEQFPEFVNFRQSKKKKSKETPATVSTHTPIEQFEAGYQQLRDDLSDELLDRVKSGTPEFFENLVVELLLKMGYGGSRQEAGQALGRSGDEGIDGVINEDRLGLDVIYLQAKKWAGTVGRPEIQRFVGALHGKRARKGVFLTTGVFSDEARKYVATIDPKVVLIDGTQLAELMIDFGVGVTLVGSYEHKRLDADYFEVE